jgi:hypothetical protein
MLTALGVKIKLDNQAPECRSHEATKAIDLWIYVNLSGPWENNEYCEVVGKSSCFRALGDFVGRRS